MYSFNIYKISELDGLGSLESKFKYINDFAQKLNKFYEVKPRNEANKAKKEKAWNNVGKKFNELLDEYKIFYDDFIKNKDASNFVDYNPNKFNKSGRYDNKSFESTDTFYSAEEPSRTSTPNDEEIMRELQDAINNGEFILFKVKNSRVLDRLSFKSIKDIVDGNIAENKVEDSMRIFNNILKNAQNVKENRIGLLNLANNVYDLLKRRKNTTGKGLNNVKKLTPQQMLTRLPILLAQIQAGNNSQKLKNEARKLLYSLYKSKMTGKTVYNTLIRRI